MSTCKVFMVKPYVIRLRNLPQDSNVEEIQQFFGNGNLKIAKEDILLVSYRPDVVSEEIGDAFVKIESDEYVQQAMLLDGGMIKDQRIQVISSSRLELRKVTQLLEKRESSLRNFVKSVGKLEELGFTTQKIRNMLGDLSLLPSYGFSYDDLNDDGEWKTISLQVRARKMSMEDSQKYEGNDLANVLSANDMSNLENRKDTLRSVGCFLFLRHDFAEAGFYWVRNLAALKCYMCSLTFDEWNAEDHPIRKHIECSPHCSLIPELKLKEMEIVDSDSDDYVTD